MLFKIEMDSKILSIVLTGSKLQKFREVIKMVGFVTPICNIIFSSGITKSKGVHIMHINDDTLILTKIHLTEQFLNNFQCNQPIINVEIDMENLYEKLCEFKQNDQIKMYINTNNPNILYIKNLSTNNEPIIEIPILKSPSSGS